MPRKRVPNLLLVRTLYSIPAMGNSASFPKSAIHGAAHSAPLPDASVGGDILIIIIQLCERVALNRHVSSLSRSR